MPTSDLGSANALPAQPAEEDWQFIDELKKPALQTLAWKRTCARSGEVSLAADAALEPRFPDPDGVLDTAYADFRRFIGLGGFPVSDTFRIVTDCVPTNLHEAFRIEVTLGECRILAGDPEGIRRGIFFIEDEMQRADGPLLPLGTLERKPVIRTRISRCFFGPINRPPKCRDELADDVDYYPDEYLNRLAHDGTNGLWLTITFRDLVRSNVVPELARGSEQRIAKLRRTVAKCARYGIRIYVFCIEPAAFSLVPSRRHPPAALLEKCPELAGHRGGSKVYFCPSTPLAQAYLEDATRTLFSDVPGLGGLIDITVGERATICPNAGAANNCPRCSKRKPWEALSDSLRAMERGMRAAAPDAELVSWPYSQITCWGPKDAVLGSSHVPENVALLQNFETGGGQMQLGKWRQAGDYWLSYIGPSPKFRAYARRARANGTRMFAKLQVGCSHEVASVPYVPVPGNLYRKYKRMHELGVSGAMQCWYFGSYPSLMTKAAGELSFAPFPKSEHRFLMTLARTDWGEHAPQVVKAWKWFSKAYGHYPLFAPFGYYGPLHCGPTWPLYMVPRDLPLTPNWLVGCADETDCRPYPPSGDRIGECIMDSHTLDEAVLLTGQMTELWQRGMQILKQVEPDVQARPERMRDIGVAETLDILFRSGHNILRFYQLREQIAWQGGEGSLGWLEDMRTIVREEQSLGERLLELARQDPRLGFNSEAEGYKFFPKALEWRLGQLRGLLDIEFPEIKKRLRQGLSAFPEYTGEKPVGPVYACRRVDRGLGLDGDLDEPGWASLERAECRIYNRNTAGRTSPAEESADPATTFWCAACDEEALYIGIRCMEPVRDEVPPPAARECVTGGSVTLNIEYRRLWPHARVLLSSNGNASFYKTSAHRDSIPLEATACLDERSWCAKMRLPFELLGHEGIPPHPLRINVIRSVSDPAESTVSQLISWTGLHPLQSRLIFAQHNSHDLGWLRFEGE